MQQKHIYEYAVVRVVPLVEREEFINVGVILFCKKQKYIRMKYKMRDDKILALSPSADIEEISNNLDAFNKVASGDKGSGPIATMNEAERFRWLTAVRSATIQTSRPHPGMCIDLDLAVEKLFNEMVE